MDILRRTETLDGYAELLAHMAGLYVWLDKRIREGLGPEAPSEFPIDRFPRLCADLRDVAALGSTSELAGFPLPPFETRHHALGALYVVEGAALGGQIVARHLFARHGLTAERGASFFANGGDPVGPRWKAFRAILDATEEFGSVLAGATATFLAFESAVVGEAALA